MRFTVNGDSVTVPPEQSEDRLLWILRDDLGLRGPRYGCGEGVCGACVIHVDGRAERACPLRAADVAGKRIVTLDAIAADDGTMHTVQRAWIEASVPQCGYCQNGQIMTAIALLAENPAADATMIAEVMDTVLCRCGTQARVRAAIAAAQRDLGAERQG